MKLLRKDYGCRRRYQLVVGDLVVCETMLVNCIDHFVVDGFETEAKCRRKGYGRAMLQQLNNEGLNLVVENIAIGAEAFWASMKNAHLVDIPDSAWF